MAANKRNVYVGGFGDEVDEKILTLACLPFGEIAQVTIPKDHQTGKHRGFGFVEFQLADDATACIDNLNESEIYGRTIIATKARPPKIYRAE